MTSANIGGKPRRKHHMRTLRWQREFIQWERGGWAYDLGLQLAGLVPPVPARHIGRSPLHAAPYGSTTSPSGRFVRSEPEIQNIPSREPVGPRTFRRLKDRGPGTITLAIDPKLMTVPDAWHEGQGPTPEP